MPDVTPPYTALFVRVRMMGLQAMPANRVFTNSSPRPWADGRETQDPSQRLMTYGPVRPMRDPGLLEILRQRLLGRH